MKLKVIIALISSILLMQFVIYLKINRTSSSMTINHRYEVLDNSVPHLVADSLKKLLEEHNVSFKDIVFNQAKIESGNFESKIFKQNNNLFGMRFAKLRPTLAIGEINGYAYYRTWQESLYDYLIFQSRYLKGAKNRDDYLQKLVDVGYAEDVEYIKKLIK